MKVEITGAALTLLEDFIKYATQENTKYGVADAMYYDYDAFFSRVNQLKNQITKSKE